MLHKIEYWKKWELAELFDDLAKAEKLLIDLGKEKSVEDMLFTTFKHDFIEEVGDTAHSNVPDFTFIWQWVTPGGEWEQLVGAQGKELGDRIFSRTDRWKRNQEFLPGAKVSLSGEYGVVLDKENQGDFLGLICWDTAKEDDIEDWRGLFGSFIDAGGEVISPDHQFNFINDDGTLKKTNL